MWPSKERGTDLHAILHAFHSYHHQIRAVSMRPINTTRTLFELRVGSIHTLEVLFQIRQADISWWNSNLRHHERQLYKLIGRRVVPVECQEEIRALRTRLHLDAGDRPNWGVGKESGTNGGRRKRGENVVIGEENLKKRSAEREKHSTTLKSRHGRKRGKQSDATATATGGKKSKTSAVDGETKSKKSSQSSTAAIAGADKYDAHATNGNDSNERKLKLLRERGKWIMGQSIQICYVMEDIDRSSATTLVFRPKVPSAPTTSDTTTTCANNSEEEKLVPLAQFRRWNKLSKRLNMWVFRFDPDNPLDLSVSEGGGFPRPELLPLSDIFRSSAGDED